MSALLTMYQQAVFALGLLQQGDDSDFKDLGKLMLAGFAFAVVVGIAFTFIRIHLRDKQPPAAAFISINPSEGNETRER